MGGSDEEDEPEYDPSQPITSGDNPIWPKDKEEEEEEEKEKEEGSKDSDKKSTE